jgi:hypothetical protein
MQCVAHVVVCWFVEFCSVMSHRVSQTYTPEEVKHAFKVFQGDAPPGLINVKVLEKALATYSGDKQAVSDAVDLLLQVTCMSPLALRERCFVSRVSCAGRSRWDGLHQLRGVCGHDDGTVPDKQHSLKICF